MDGCLFEIANGIANVDRPIDEGLHPRTRLQVPDVEKDSARIGTLRIADDPRWHGKANAIPKDRGVKDDVSIHWSDRFSTSKEENLDKFTE